MRRNTAIGRSERRFFSMGDMSKIRAYIEKLIKRGDNQNLIFDIDHGKIRPSKKVARRNC